MVLERNSFCLVCTVDKLHKFIGESMLRYPLGWVFLMLFHKFCNIFEGQEGEHFQITLDSIIWGPHEILNDASVKTTQSIYI